MLHVFLLVFVANGAPPRLTWVNLVSLLVGVVAPILVALVNKGHQVKAKAIELAAISGATGVLNEWLVASGSFDWGQALINAVITFIIAVAAIFGLWEPTGVSDKARAAGNT